MYEEYPAGFRFIDFGYDRAFDLRRLPGREVTCGEVDSFFEYDRSGYQKTGLIRGEAALQNGDQSLTGEILQVVQRNADPGVGMSRKQGCQCPLGGEEAWLSSL